MTENTTNPAQEATSDGLNAPAESPRPWNPFRTPQMPTRRHDFSCPDRCDFCEHLISQAEDRQNELPLPSEDWK